MIYKPDHYKVEREDLILEIVRDYGFATLLSQASNGLHISHIPLLLEDDGNSRSLIGHLARANPHAQQLAENPSVTAIFHGPHAYVSPAWYEPRPANVPTWNYVAVHVSGLVELVEDARESFGILQKLVKTFETRYQTGWSMPDLPNADLQRLVKSIVSFRITIENIEAKFKLSQKQNSTDRENVMSMLGNFGEDGREIAALMGRVSPTSIKAKD